MSDRPDPAGPAAPVASREAAAAAREGGLSRSLSQRQVVMMGLGSAIGTGLFAGSGLAVGYAGPAVLVSYAVAAIAAFAVVLSLSEMSTALPAAGSFGVYAETWLSPLAGFVIRLSYWMAQVVAIGGEAVAAGLYMRFWFPAVPVWAWTLAFSVGLLQLNSRPVKSFGSVEFWLAVVKVAGILAFIVLGLARILGLGAAPVGWRNLYALPGGFFPHGARGVWMALIMGVFSFSGVELVAVASAESRDPRRTAPAALRSLGARLLLFYMLSLLVMLALEPWPRLGGATVTGSPFVQVFQSAGVRQAAGLMNFVVLTAALSSMNANLYLSSRTLFSLSRSGWAPAVFGRLTRARVPGAATLASGVAVLGAAAVSLFTPKAYNIFFGVALFGEITVWVLILATHFAYRRSLKGRRPEAASPFFPLVQLLGLGVLAAVLLAMASDKDWRVAWWCGAPFVAGLALIYAVRRGRLGPSGGEFQHEEPSPAGLH